MKRFLSALLITASLVSDVTYAAEKIVYIDINAVFNGFYKKQLAEDQVRQQANEIKLGRKEMEEGVKELQDQVEILRADSRDDALSEEIREGKRNQLEQMLIDLQQDGCEMVDLEKASIQQMEQRNVRVTRKILDEILEKINDYSKENVFTSVIDRSAEIRSGMPVVLYVNPKSDITADVLALLNEGHEEILIQKTTGEEQ